MPNLPALPCPALPCPANIEDFDGDILAVVGIGDVEAFERLEDDSLNLLDEFSSVDIESLELHIDINLIAQVRNHRSAAWNILDLLIKPARACSPQEGYIESEIVGMHLISNASLGPELGPGVSLDAVFFAEEIISHNIQYDYIDFQDSRKLDEYGPTNPAIAGAGYVLTPSTSSSGMKPEAQATELHQFTYSIELSTGELFEVVSNGVLVSSVND